MPDDKERVARMLGDLVRDYGPSVTIHDARICVRLEQHAGAKRVTSIGRDRLAEETGLTSEGVRKCLRRLEGLGALERVSVTVGRGRCAANEYRLLWGDTREEKQPLPPTALTPYSSPTLSREPVKPVLLRSVGNKSILTEGNRDKTVREEREDKPSIRVMPTRGRLERIAKVHEREAKALEQGWLGEALDIYEIRQPMRGECVRAIVGHPHGEQAARCILGYAESRLNRHPGRAGWVINRLLELESNPDGWREYGEWEGEGMRIGLGG
jgi:DNA-binding Lrp family transcriptional regulator